MGKNKLYILPLLAIVVTGCNKATSGETSFSSEQETSYSSFIVETSTYIEPSTSYLSTSEATSSKESIVSSETEPSISSEDTTSEIEIPSKNENLPIGNKTTTGPKNKKAIDISDYIDFTFNNCLPEYWSYIQGNNKLTSQGDYYATGNFKFSHLYYGLQTPLLTSYKKIEIRINIAEIHNCKDDGKDKDEPIFHIYGYDKTAHMVSFDTIEQGSITTSTVNNYVRIYIRNIDISYLEFRLNANPCKSSQHYNFGVDKITIKGWDFD